MRLPLSDASDRSSIDQELVNRMIDAYLKDGFTYFDTAYVYHNGLSEVAFREAVAKRYPRDAFTITDKMPVWEVKSYEDYQRLFDIQLERCGVEYFDYYWLHALGKSSYEDSERLGGFDFVKKLKADGKAKHIGFSFHDNAEVLDRILTEHPEMEYVQLQINYIDWEDDNVQSRKCYEVATKHRKPIVVMEPVKGGSLAQLPEEAEKLLKSVQPNMSVASWAIRYAASLDGVLTVLSGMSNLEQTADNIGTMRDFAPLNDEEMATVAKVVEIIHGSIAIPCTSCNYCTEGCPEFIPIPEYFALYNNQRQFPMNSSARKGDYAKLTEGHGRASDCIACLQCESHCPQHIDISERMKEVALAFDR
jgi:hypothetical protein